LRVPLKIKKKINIASFFGPLIFVIFINDLSEKIANKYKVFADNTKVLSKIGNQDSIDVLQEDMNKLSE
jgi:ribonuclease P/MRP protein subunit RPP40